MRVKSVGSAANARLLQQYLFRFAGLFLGYHETHFFTFCLHIGKELLQCYAVPRYFVTEVFCPA